MRREEKKLKNCLLLMRGQKNFFKEKRENDRITFSNVDDCVKRRHSI